MFPLRRHKPPRLRNLLILLLFFQTLQFRLHIRHLIFKRSLLTQYILQQCILIIQQSHHFFMSTTLIQLFI